MSLFLNKNNPYDDNRYLLQRYFFETVLNKIYMHNKCKYDLFVHATNTPQLILATLWNLYGMVAF